MCNGSCRPDAIAAEHLDIKRETGFEMHPCQICNRDFICLTAIEFNLTHLGLPYLTFVLIFMRCVAGDFKKKKCSVKMKVFALLFSTYFRHFS